MLIRPLLHFDAQQVAYNRHYRVLSVLRLGEHQRPGAVEDLVRHLIGLAGQAVHKLPVRCGVLAQFLGNLHWGGEVWVRVSFMGGYLSTRHSLSRAHSRVSRSELARKGGGIAGRLTTILIDSESSPEA